MKNQRGAALLIALLILVLTATASLLGVFNSRNSQDARDRDAQAALASAKEAVMAYSIAVGQRPGDMPRPDTLSSSEIPPNNYNGEANGGCYDTSAPGGNPPKISGVSIRCIGRLPWKTIGTGYSVSIPEHDPSGEIPWYAISANLADPGCLLMLNPGTISLSYSGSFQCANPSQLPYPWLTVRDKLGNVLSDRVAFVVILPGPPLPGQNRTPYPNLGGATQYLDSITVTQVTSGCTSPPCVFSNAALDNDFVIADDSNVVGNSPSGYQAPYYFNDRLLYVTIDELMRAISARAAGEARRYLLKFKSDYGYLPYAGSLDYQTGSCSEGNRQGSLPFPIPTCTYDGSAKFSCSSIGTFKLALLSGSFTQASGGCSYIGGQCSCTGSGQCDKTTGSQKGSFICDTQGNCSITNTLIGNPSLQMPSGTMTATGNCTTSGADCSCTGSGACTYTTGANCSDQTLLNNLYSSFPLPSWFIDNNWHRYLFYAVSHNSVKPPAGATGIKLDQSQLLFLIANFGTAKAGQNRPSPSLSDYLDDPNQGSGDQFSSPSSTSNDLFYGTSP